MLIRRIEVRNFRRLVGPVVIDGLKEGINIIAGDNEEGKSTLLHAMQAALFQRHNSTSQQVKEFMPYNCQVRPEVSLHFELDLKKYSIHKGFCTKPFLAEFRSPTGTFQGAEAEEQIRELFKLPTAVKGKKVAESDQGLWGLLWLEQDSASKGLGTTEGGKESLMKVLESDLSNVLGGQSGRALLKQISLQHSQYFTPSTNKEKGDYKEARERYLDVSQRHEECQVKFEQYKKKLIELAKNQDAIATHHREKTLENAKAEVENAAKEVTRIEKLALEVDALRQAERSALLEYQSLKTKFDARTELSARKQTLETALAEKEVTIKKLQTEVDRCQTDLELLKSKHVAAEAVLQSAVLECQQAEKREELTKLLSARTELAKKIQSVEELQLQLETDIANAKKIVIDAEIFQKLRGLEAQKIEAETRADMTATKLTLRPLSPSNEASIGNKKIESKSLSLTKKTTITFEEWGEVDVTPGGEDIEQRVKAMELKRKEFSSELTRIGIASVQEAQELWDKRKQLLSDIEYGGQQIATICGAGGLSALMKEFQKLDEEIQNRGAGGGTDEGSVSNLADLRLARDKAQELEKSAKVSFESEKELHSKRTTELTKLILEKNSTSTSLTELTAQLQELCKEEADTQRKALADAEQKHLTAQSETQQKVLELNNSNPEECKSKHAQCKIKCNQIELEIQSLSKAIIELTAEINAQGTNGLGEELERLQGEKELAEGAFKRIEQKALALKLLNQVLTDAEREAKDQFLEPVLEKLNPHLQTVFPGAKIILDNQDVEISRLKRDGVEEDYAKLSVGTREQLSVLMRLSIASLMKEKGQPCVVVLDDALVYSDDGRIAKMKKVLKEVAATTQVIVLTCRLRDYADLEGANIRDLHVGDRAIVT